ncbi:purine-binding chemotaxis protein CheW [Gracilibacillus ureilyticus]|uniref:Chemotaxis protein CheW n=1 Tax=Gracilibacillus ureilyticus TaxID=531814 RepID=A0A1H9L7K3_9BACI|nr:chemotaxis protein CheW [Gracilibacillus ureilyticus]SER06973.1 purine-binding chemotaxis protein CheW [Gracilibacillus ureilyticus]
MEGTKNQQSIIIELEKEEYAIPVELIGGIERMQHITRVPKTAEFVKGVINLRGVVTPILDLRERFGMDPIAQTDSTRIIIVHMEKFDVGFIVDAAYDVLDIPQEIIEPAPKVIGTVDADYIEGVAKVDKRLIMLLQLENVLSLESYEKAREGTHL